METNKKAAQSKLVGNANQANEWLDELFQQLTDRQAGRQTQEADDWVLLFSIRQLMLRLMAQRQLVQNIIFTTDLCQLVAV